MKVSTNHRADRYIGWLPTCPAQLLASTPLLWHAAIQATGRTVRLKMRTCEFWTGRQNENGKMFDPYFQSLKSSLPEISSNLKLRAWIKTEIFIFVNAGPPHIGKVCASQFPPGIWSRGPSNFGWLEPEPKIFRWWSRSPKFGFRFKRII